MIYFGAVFVVSASILWVSGSWLSNGVPTGDEVRYLLYLEQLRQGEYAYATDNITGRLRNGPGFPMLLYLADRFAGAEYLKYVPIVMGSLGVAGTAVLVRHYVNFGISLIAAFFVLFYPPTFISGTRLLTEPVVLGLIVLISLLLRSLHTPTSVYLKIVATGTLVALTALTKVIFFYVFVAFGIFVAASQFWFHVKGMAFERQYSSRVSVSILVGLLLFSPYLLYTHSVTGKALTLGTTSGETLYWMTVKHPRVNGAWMSLDKASEHLGVDHRYVKPLLEIRSKGGAEYDLDREVMALATANLRNDPGVYAQNWVANVSRFFLNRPTAFRYQSLPSLGFLIPNMLILVAMFGAFLLARFWFRRVPVTIIFLMGIGAIYTGGMSLVSTSGKQFIPLVPLVVLFDCWVWHVIVQELRLGHQMRESQGQAARTADSL